MNNNNTFTYPSYYFDLIEFSCRFVKENCGENNRIMDKQQGSFGDMFAVLTMTQCTSEPPVEEIFDKLIEFYNEEYLYISYFAIRFAESIGYDFIWLYEAREKMRRLEDFYENNFGQFLSTFGNSVEFISFLKNYLGMRKIIRQEELLNLMQIFPSEHNRPRFLVHALRELKVLKHHYDIESYKFFIHTIAQRVDLPPNVISFTLNQLKWMDGARKYKEEDDRRNECTFES